MPNYPCLVWGRVFSRRGSLRNHSKTHNTVVDRVLQEISEVVEREQLEEEINVETSDNELVGMEVSDEQEEIIDNDEQLEVSNDEQEEEVIDDEHLESMGDDEQVENDEEEIDNEEEEEEEKEDDKDKEV